MNTGKKFEGSNRVFHRKRLGNASPLDTDDVSEKIARSHINHEK
jgi:hypothetical protein